MVAKLEVSIELRYIKNRTGKWRHFPVLFLVYLREKYKNIDLDKSGAIEMKSSTHLPLSKINLDLNL